MDSIVNQIEVSVRAGLTGEGTGRTVPQILTDMLVVYGIYAKINLNVSRFWRR